MAWRRPAAQLYPFIKPPDEPLVYTEVGLRPTTTKQMEHNREVLLRKRERGERTDRMFHPLTHAPFSRYEENGVVYSEVNLPPKVPLATNPTYDGGPSIDLPRFVPRSKRS